MIRFGTSGWRPVLAEDHTDFADLPIARIDRTDGQKFFFVGRRRIAIRPPAREAFVRTYAESASEGETGRLPDLARRYVPEG